MSPVFGGGIVVTMLGLWVAVLVWWIRSILEISRLPDQQFQAAGTEKINWLLVVVLAGVIGTAIWWFAKRKQVLAAPAFLAAPPGWYPAPDGTGGMQWWNGAAWTADRHPPAGSG